jgi:hypothetical protein
MSESAIKKLVAIDLFLEDVRTINSNIRTRAKGEGCEHDLNVFQEKVIKFLENERSSIDWK